MDLDTALLRTWLVVADERHLGRAADRLGVSQQAVSQRVDRLSQLLGTPLVERSGRGIALTARGAALVAPARQVVDAVDQIADDLGAQQRPLRIDVLDEHLSLLPFVIAEAPPSPAAAAAVEVVMRGELASVTDWLRGGYADLSFGRPGPLGPDWPDDLARGTPLLEPICVLVSERHPWAARSELRPRELGDCPVWFPGTGAPGEWRELLREFARDFGIALDGSGSTMGIAQFAASIAASDRVASLWGGAMSDPPAGLRVVPLVDPVPVFAWVPMWRRGRDRRVRQVAESIIARARAATPEPHVDDAWLPATDRTLLRPS